MKVLVMSNHTIIRQSLISLLQKLPMDEPVNLGACGANEIVERARAWEPDVILLESMTDRDRASGISRVRTLSAEIPDAHIVVLGRDADETAIHEAISAGADGYMNGDTSSESFARTLKGVMRGELGLSRVTALRVVRHLRRAASQPFAPLPTSLSRKLTQREQEVFNLVRQGKRSREISERLYIAESTVYKHIQNILDKLQVHSRAQAIFIVDAPDEYVPLDGRQRATGE